MTRAGVTLCGITIECHECPNRPYCSKEDADTAFSDVKREENTSADTHV